MSIRTKSDIRKYRVIGSIGASFSFLKDIWLQKSLKEVSLRISCVQRFMDVGQTYFPTRSFVYNDISEENKI